jgi:hypothetical protein
MQPFHGVGHPPSFSLAPKAQIGNIPISAKASALLPCFAAAELNCSRRCHARKRIARECWKFVALEQPRDESGFAICPPMVDQPGPILTERNDL